MPDRRLMVAAFAAAAAVGVAGCSGGNAGDAQPAPRTKGSEATSASPERKLPDRPREVRLDGKDPCSLLTDDQKRRFALDRPPQKLEDSTFKGAPTCHIRSEAKDISAAVATITGMGIENFGPGQVNGDVRELKVQGFPAYEIRTPGAPVGSDFCTVNVDVADGQVLRAHYSESGTKQPLGKDELCQRAAQVADAAMTTLVAG
ncbi:hypothetical protein GCM10012275_43570 [Longimycelium tulufanense]|uniref:DUF3558 domain-containing protein n=1 Tax=Longimycelium tulufanense TaxID=907463 RepID=A0A8J3CH22_9PSEU|nr:DUF3558 domain-containing protein [Longimycelium tulufanense]GGM68370.1 hypothetical protein GCM10012275_43570 [Longimycelium tulufanense]